MELIREKWTKDDYQDFCTEMLGISDAEYADFVKRGTPTERPFIGVRIPQLRAMAKQISEGNGRDFLKFSAMSFEELAVKGFVIAALPYEEMMTRLDGYLELIDNWGNCDTFCASLKSVKRHKPEFLEKIDKYFDSLDEFKVRFGLVMLLSYYVEGEYLAVIFDRINTMAEFLSDGPGEMGIRFSGEGKLLAWDAYYVKMAIAWLISVCFAKFPEETMAWFKTAHLPKWTHNKSIAKTCESLRVDRDLKEELKGLRK